MQCSRSKFSAVNCSGDKFSVISISLVEFEWSECSIITSATGVEQRVNRELISGASGYGQWGSNYFINRKLLPYLKEDFSSLRNETKCSEPKITSFLF
jgi:hypothetical protein